MVSARAGETRKIGSHDFRDHTEIDTQIRRFCLFQKCLTKKCLATQIVLDAFLVRSRTNARERLAGVLRPLSLHAISASAYS
jgi:hypothetical protein